MGFVGCLPDILRRIVVKRCGISAGSFSAAFNTLCKDYLLDGNLAVVGVAAKVKHHLYGGGIDALEATEGEGELFKGGDVALLGEQEVAVVGGVGELECDTVYVLAGFYLALEVIELFCIEGDGCVGDQMQLVLPLQAGRLGCGKAVFVALLSKFGRVNL